MRPILVLAAVIAAVFITGALLSYPVYLLFSYTTDTGFSKALHYSTLLTGLALGLYYLKVTDTAKSVFGLERGYRDNAGELFSGFLAGLVILMTVETSLYILDMRQADPGLAQGFMMFLFTVLKAVVTGIAVGLLEESLFRGAIYTGLARHATNLTALLVTSLLYSAVHFIDFPELPVNEPANWTTGFMLLAGSLDRFADPMVLDSFLTLAVLGLLLGMMRWHTGNILLCTGVHAGIVTINKIFSYATDFRMGSPYEFLVNAYDHQTGHLATFWLLLVCLLYYFLYMKRQKSGVR